MEDWNIFVLKAIFFETIERSVFPLIFGAIHAMLIDNLLIQTITLGFVEICYFLSKMMVLRLNLSNCSFKVAMLAVTSLLRMVLILTLYVYEA